MKPLVSIIIPTFNRGNLIKETLDSIIAQSYKCWECIVVDDGSNDGTRSLMLTYSKKEPRIYYYERPLDVKKGASACRNYGYALSKGDYIQWFDSDDIMKDDLLEKKLNFLEINPQFDFCISQMQAFQTVEGERIGLNVTSTIVPNNLFEDYVLGKFSAGTPSILWKKQIIAQQKYLFDENLSQSDDLEFYTRIFRENSKMGVIHEPLIFYRKHNSSICGQFLNMDRNHLNSFLEVEKRKLKLLTRLEHKKVIIDRVMDNFRYSLTFKNYENCKKCLRFVNENNDIRSLKYLISFYTVTFFYIIVKKAGRGETSLKRFFRIRSL